MPTNPGFKGISFPFRFSGKGGVETSTTSPTNTAHIDESIQQIIRTRVTERVNEMLFGTDSETFLFEPLSGDATILAVAAFQIEQALKMWEPRIQVDDVTAIPDPNNSANMLVTVSYTVIQTQFSTTTQANLQIPQAV